MQDAIQFKLKCFSMVIYCCKLNASKQPKQKKTNNNRTLNSENQSEIINQMISQNRSFTSPWVYQVTEKKVCIAWHFANL